MSSYYPILVLYNVFLKCENNVCKWPKLQTNKTEVSHIFTHCLIYGLKTEFNLHIIWPSVGFVKINQWEQINWFSNIYL